MTAAAAVTTAPTTSRSRRREALVAAGWGTLIFAVTMLPYAVGHLTVPDGKVFNGFFFLGDDGATYIAKMRAGANGAWGWSDPYVSSPVGQPVLLFLFYLLWGKLAALAHVPLLVAFHAARFTGAVALVFAVRRLAAAVLPEGRSRGLAVVLGLVGSGAGFALALVGAASGQAAILGQPLAALDLHVPEISGFFSIMTFPHFTWAAALMALAVVDLIEISRATAWAAAWSRIGRASVVMLLLTLIHPQMLVVLAILALVAAAGFRVPPARWPTLALPFLVCAPLLAYFASILAGDPVVSAWTRQWQQSAYEVLPTLFAFGVPLLLALAALVIRRRSLTPELVVLTAWIAAVGVLLYLPSPISIQRRLFDGIALPIGVLAAVAVDSLARPRPSLRPWHRLAALSVAVCSVTSILVLAVPLLEVGSGVPDLYLDAAEARAMDWMAATAGSGTPPAVLSTFDTGLQIPPRAGDRVYAGHYSETIDSAAKRPAAAAAIRKGGPELVAFMREQGVTYLFVGPREVSSGVGPIAADLGVVYDRDGVRVYQLRR